MVERSADAYGLLAEFEKPEDLVEAAKRARAQGYRELDAFSPFPVYELKSVLRLNDNRVRWLGLIGGFTGAGLALAMQLYTNYSYQINVGGRPLYALSAFAVIIFELTILFSALFAAIGMLTLNGLPRLHHPVFGAKNFHRASRDRFFLCVLANDPKFERAATRKFLHGLGGKNIELVDQ